MAVTTCGGPADLERGSLEKETTTRDGQLITPGFGSEPTEIIKAHELQQEKGFLRTLRRGEEWLDEKMGIETQGIDRIKEEDKKPPSTLNCFFMWWSMTCHVGTLPVGFLGPEFGLSLGQSIAAIVIGTILGAMCTVFCGTLGPKLGLRAIATSRYSFGFYGAKFCSVLNVVMGVGFSIVNVVVVGQVLSAVSNYTMSIAVGCVIIGVVGYVVCLFGFAVIHTYEKYAWIASFTILCVLLGQVGPKIEPSYPATSTGVAHAGVFLSFLAINFSSASAWCSIAADYYCNYPSNTKAWTTCLLTFFGVVLPTVFTTIVGACLGNIAFNITSAGDAEVVTYGYPTLAQAYNEHGLGGILRESYHPLGFSKFILVLLVFSVIGNNVAVNYSTGLSLQLLGHYFHAIPRFIWSFLNALIVTILAIAGRESLSIIVSNFVSMLGYWSISFTFILLIEDKYFRRTEGYDLNVWDVPSKLPLGIAAITALIVGYVAGGVTGMSQAWYIGPIAKKFGPQGGDVGIFLSGVLTLLIYPPARWYEKKMTKR